MLLKIIFVQGPALKAAVHLSSGLKVFMLYVWSLYNDDILPKNVFH